MIEKHTKLLNSLSATIIILLLVIISFTFYNIIIDDNPPVEFYNIPFPIDSTTYHVGDSILMFMDFCKYSSLPFDVTVSFINEIIYTTPVQRLSGVPTLGCQAIWTNIITIPQHIPPGKYHLVGKIEYEINFMRSRVVEWETLSFEIVP
jgi:hypothetical protein